MILDINECQTNFPCHSNATCNNTDGSYLCKCDSGYSGDGFTCAGKTKYIDWALRRLWDKQLTNSSRE